jgi:glycosyltransferase involved in cell wall biosynthesis
MHTDITVVMTCHAEGRLMHSTLKSIDAAAQHARDFGQIVETVVVADCPSEETMEYLSHCKNENTRVIPVTVDDAGLTRNAGVNEARGEYVAFIDGDDIMCHTWLLEAAREIDKVDHPSILHPETKLYFERENYIQRNIDQESSEFHLENLFQHNYWALCYFAAREVFIDTPFQASQIAHGFGNEDWHWNCETVAKGIKHKVVPNTLVGIRLKSWQRSLMQKTNFQQCVIMPTKLFELQTV